MLKLNGGGDFFFNKGEGGRWREWNVMACIFIKSSLKIPVKRRTTKIGFVRTKDTERFPITNRVPNFNFNMSMDNSIII